MARSRSRCGGPKRGVFKPKKMGKGYLSVRTQPIGSRPVLRITDPEEGEGDKSADKSDKSEE